MADKDEVKIAQPPSNSDVNNGKIENPPKPANQEMSAEDVANYNKEKANEIQNPQNQTQLHLASDPETVKNLLSSGADFNAVDKRGRTPLFYTTDPVSAQLLIDAGADINAKDKDGWTPLLYSMANGKSYPNPNTEVTKTLINNGADVNEGDSYGLTPLHIASGMQNVSGEVVSLLVEKGADVNAKDTYGFTPLDTLALTGKEPNKEKTLSLAYAGAKVESATIKESKGVFDVLSGDLNNMFPSAPEKEPVLSKIDLPDPTARVESVMKGQDLATSGGIDSGQSTSQNKGMNAAQTLLSMLGYQEPQQQQNSAQKDQTTEVVLKVLANIIMTLVKDQNEQPLSLNDILNALLEELEKSQENGGAKMNNSGSHFKPVTSSNPNIDKVTQRIDDHTNEARNDEVVEPEKTEEPVNEAANEAKNEMDAGLDDFMEVISGATQTAQQTQTAEPEKQQQAQQTQTAGPKQEQQTQQAKVSENQGEKSGRDWGAFAKQNKRGAEDGKWADRMSKDDKPAGIEVGR